MKREEFRKLGFSDDELKQQQCRPGQQLPHAKTYCVLGTELVVVANTSEADIKFSMYLFNT